MSKVCKDWSFTSNHASDPDGRIIIIWKNPAAVSILHQSRQSLTCEVNIAGTIKFIFTAIYAANLASDRADLWVDLLSIQQLHQLDICPWVVGGDFNQITHFAEHSSPTVNHLDPPMTDFRNTLTQLGLFDLRYLGPLFTWSNKCPTYPVAKKLDRFLVNHPWIASHPHSQANFLAPEVSDHSPAILDLAVDLPRAGTKPFKFYNFLTKHPDFCQLVRALTDPTSANFQEEKTVMAKLVFLRSIEESYFRQRSRICWLKEGDHNTSFFHRLTQVRNSNNSIRSFCLANGDIISDPIAMGQIAISHFKNILAPPFLPITTSSPLWIQNLTDYRCPQELHNSLTSFPVAEDITSTLFKINPNKSPGPDGLTSGFFKAAWPIVGVDVLSGISSFFRTGHLPPASNATILSLLPKHPGASAIGDYRPISCCNTIYKLISKLLVKRLKPLLPNMILPNQTAFVQGRLLVENTVLASEIVHGYHRDKGPSRITLKVDIAKAFDTVNWRFIFNCLQGMGLPQTLIQWIQVCISTPSFMIGFNGTVQGYFKSNRGLRQGDPLSPYLFVIAMNCLSLMLDKAAEEGKFGYHHACKDTKLTHLCFADDLLIFCDGSLQSVKNVLEVLEAFKQASGLTVSITKTCFFTSGVHQAEIDHIEEECGLSRGMLPVRYLGVPLCTRKLSLANCDPLIQQVKNKINSWTAKTLSFAGRLLLINTVIAGIANFWCSTFTIPKKCIEIINSLCGAYLWKGSSEGSHSARVSWETVTLSKDEGGLGIRNLVWWNKACSVKLLWLLFFRAGSIWVAWFIQNVLSGDLSNLWTLREKQTHSSSTKKILRVRDYVYNWIKIVPGSGKNCRFWSDNWSPYGNLRQYFGLAPTTSLGIRASATLHDLFQQGRWLLPQPRSEAQLNLHIHLSTITLSEVNDEYTWSPLGSPLSTFSTGQVYNEIRPHQQKVPWHASIWSSRAYRDPPSQNSIDYSSSSHGKPPYTSSGLNATTVSIGSSFGQLRLSRGKPTCSSETASQASETKTPDSPPQCSSFGLIDDLLSV
ncbi:uncharacterized protein LOC117129330 [Brassica rapa]|uniref:uncharacterized protein LOC117125929 n=1 Tax=Brassica campestris TaxID=3711 RepID=UPI00142E2958|nr:uncharacterized protein LOC117125929 [Brassica rapa]XP_033138815.1 uncharacterized protein LOC117129330 [Brassica rapa]